MSDVPTTRKGGMVEIWPGVSVSIQDAIDLDADAAIYGDQFVKREGDHYVRVPPEKVVPEPWRAPPHSEAG